MDVREAVRQVVRQATRQAMAEKAATAPVVVAAEPREDPIDIGELQVSEYIVFLLAVDTYLRYLEEATGVDDAEDDVSNRGLRLLRAADSDLSQIQGFLDENLPSATHKKMLTRAMAMRATSPSGVSRRALQLRTLLSRGGASTMRAIFTTNRALKQVREAIAASMMNNADAALDIFAAFPMRNIRLGDWIDTAAKTAGSGTTPQNAVVVGSKESADQAGDLLAQSVQQIASSGAEESKQAQDSQSEILQQVQSDAQEAARKALERSGEPDEPLVRSEVVGVAVAAATAAVSDPSNARNIPATLITLDDEQRAAALTDGRVAVFAGAGSGKSTTLVARVAYLVKERRVMPSRILVTSFNTKAADELGEKIGKAAGDDAVKQMSVGTMHSLFRRFIGEFGTPEEKWRIGAVGRNEASGFVGDGKKIAMAVQRVWEDCKPKIAGSLGGDAEEDPFAEFYPGSSPRPDKTPEAAPVPKLKDMLMSMARWAGNDVSPQQALDTATSPSEVTAATWYQMYEGMKGTIPGWKPTCPSKGYEAFMMKNRPNGKKLGDFTDMLKVFRDILRRDPRVRGAVQKMYDHIIVDEAQDRNTLMAGVIDMMSEHVTDGGDGKSVWIVGDDRQAINSFQGAKSALFRDLYQKEGWKTRTMRTNYRCEPEIVDAANSLIAHNEKNVPVPAVPAPGKTYGTGSIVVSNPTDEAEAAIDTIHEIKQNMVLGGKVTDHAVLCRTNKELHAFETACIIRGVPYARKGTGSFFGSPETTAVLGYVQLVTGTDFAKAQKSLGLVINKPQRFFLTQPDKAADAVADAFQKYARFLRVDINTINPVSALQDDDFVGMLTENLGKLTRTGKTFKFDQKIMDIGYAVEEMQARTRDPEYQTKDLFDDILGLKGVAMKDGEFVEQSFRESLKADLRNAVGEDADEDEDDEDEESPHKGLGNVGFLYELARVDPTDEDDDRNPPTTPAGFASKMERYATRMRDLRIDTTKWYKAQKDLPASKRTPPPGVYLGTVHSTKGSEWNTTFVQMPKGKFPMERKPKPGEPQPSIEVEEEKMEDERQLAYVALTRAAKNLRVICPKVIGGKKAGVSPFVSEANLAIGENVKNPETGMAKTALGPNPIDDSEGSGWEELPMDDGSGDLTPWNPDEV